VNDLEHEKDNEAWEDSEVEITDLDLPADDGIIRSSLFAGHFLTWQRSLNRRRVRLAMSLGMLFLAALVILLNVHISIPSPVVPHNNSAAQYVAMPLPINIEPSMVILPQKDGFACVNDAAWSPDSKYIAFLGYLKDCASSGYEAGLITVHDALSGNLVEQLSPDNAILHAFSRQFPAAHKAPVIYNGSILWSPDGKDLALTFSLGFPFSMEAGFNGVILIPNGSANVRVLLRFSQNISLPVEWDLQQPQAPGSPSISSMSPYIAAGTALSPAFAYGWGTNGALVPLRVHGHHIIIPRSRLGDSQLGRIGNPDGDRSFTIWQPGTSTLTTQAQYGITVVPAVYTWSTNFVVWSPDGRYLVDSFFLQGRLQLPGQPFSDPRTLSNLHMDQLPVLTVRDMALQHLLTTLNPAGLNVMIAWHPEGFILAAYNSQTADVDLFDCVTGYEIASLRLPSPFATPTLAGTPLMRWSPDGSRLFLFDPQLGMAMLWKVNDLSG